MMRIWGSVCNVKGCMAMMSKNWILFWSSHASAGRLLADLIYFGINCLNINPYGFGKSLRIESEKNTSVAAPYDRSAAPK